MVVKSTAHLGIYCGGTAVATLPHHVHRLEAWGNPVCYTTLVCDSDDKSKSKVEGITRAYLDLSPTPEELATQLAEPETLTPIARDILKQHPHDFGPTNCGKGAGTKRYVTQFYLEMRRDDLIGAIAHCVDELLELGASRIQPHVIGSRGGGNGSSLTILIPWLLSEPAARATILQGCTDVHLNLPIVHLIDTTCHVRNSDPPQDWRIQSNQWFNTADIEYAMTQKGPNGDVAVDYATFIGYGSAKGKWLSDIDKVAAEAGASLAMQYLFHDDIQSREQDFMFANSPTPYRGRPGVSSTDPEEPQS